MAGVLDAVTVDLPPTPTYPRREATWVPGDIPGDGTLIVRLWRGKRPGSRCESAAYLVEADEPIGHYGRGWLLCTEDGEVYRTVVGPYPSCTCKAGLCGLGCKHADALRGLIAGGVL